MNVTWIMTISAAAAVLTACATSDKMTMPDGAAAYHISCDGWAQTEAECYAKAGELCPAGYAVLGGNLESHSLAYSGGGATGNSWSHQGGASYSSFGVPIISRDLYVRCTQPQASAPVIAAPAPAPAYTPAPQQVQSAPPGFSY